MRLGAADIIIDRDPNGRAATGEPLYEEVFLPVGSPENAARFSNPRSISEDGGMNHHLPSGRLSDQTRMWWQSEGRSLEGYPLLAVSEELDGFPTGA